MKLFNWQVGLGAGLILLSALCYTVHYLLFHDAHHLFMFLVGDIAFVFIEVLLVTMILHRLLEHRERKAKLKKLNMVIGSFFTESGMELLKRLAAFDPKTVSNREPFLVEPNWSARDFARASRSLASSDFQLPPSRGDLPGLRTFLETKRSHLLRLLENPNILEHERFTDLLWGISHLAEELHHREDLVTLSKEDQAHLAGDLNRAYTHLLREWLSYMEHLSEDYPYLFSLACRLNPFNPEARAEIG